LFPVGRCEWDAGETAVVIGRAFFETPSTLVLKRTRSGLSAVVYEQTDGRFVRRPQFAELVERKRAPVPPLSDDTRVRLAERLGGAARRCKLCGSDARAGQRCACGTSITARDPAYVMSAEEQAAGSAAHPDVWRAAALLAELKAAGHAVPSGPRQLPATADALFGTEPDRLPRVLLVTWQGSGMRIDFDEQVVSDALARISGTG
jgi:hypothetical protein